jgi:hypothetical protein
MVMKSAENSRGAKAFLIGVIIAILIALIKSFSIKLYVDYNQLFYLILFGLGVIIGFVNVNSKDINSFLISGVVLVIVSKFGLDGIIDRLGGSILGLSTFTLIAQEIFGALLVLFIPAVIIVALRSLFNISN